MKKKKSISKSSWYVHQLVPLCAWFLPCTSNRTRTTSYINGIWFVCVCVCVERGGEAFLTLTKQIMYILNAIRCNQLFTFGLVVKKYCTYKELYGMGNIFFSIVHSIWLNRRQNPVPYFKIQKRRDIEEKMISVTIMILMQPMVVYPSNCQNS